jgi:hypothetical protein
MIHYFDMIKDKIITEGGLIMKITNLNGQKTTVILLAILFALNMMAFFLPLNPFNTQAILNNAEGVQIPDIMVIYSPNQLYQFLSQIQESGRDAFQGMHLTIDLSFPIIYSLLFFFIMRWQLFILGKQKSLLPLVSLLAGGFDLAENFTLFYITSHFPQFLTNVSTLAQGLTILKFALIITCISLILILLSKSMIDKKNQKADHPSFS